ncbi:MAG: thioredoxin family protein [Spirochaetales bacterium]|jgi:small redox-active disulfide protein 2|nr:thioredoxin family protein [Spirochaetales bacterium]
MIIQILGSGCTKCKTLEANARLAIEEGGLDASIKKITDLDQIMEMGVLMTPALAVDGTVLSVGKVLNPKQVLTLVSQQ